jgi:hypothetical protein
MSSHTSIVFSRPGEIKAIMLCEPITVSQVGGTLRSCERDNLRARDIFSLSGSFSKKSLARTTTQNEKVCIFVTWPPPCVGNAQTEIYYFITQGVRYGRVTWPHPSPLEANY